MATQTMTMARALNEGLRRALESNPKVLLMGEDIGKLGGVFRITDGLQKDFGEDRVIDAPLAESAIVGTAVGLAVRGYRTVVEMQFDGFVYPAFDQIVSQVAKLHKRTDGVYTMGLVIRLPYQGGIGAIEHHSESPEAYFAHTAGLRVVTCSTPNDAYWMIQQSIDHDDPIIFCEPKSRYWEKGEVDLDSPPQGLFDAVVRRAGTDVTMIAYGSMVKTARRAAEAAAGEGVSVEVIDARSLSPLDLAP
ncbi:MAG: alpha-ketoacid dehydrogenase subunit beta, partial [Acidobacteriota bacterium]|nr:alpha-ketoacid dehydrogenase subunit beta [Acidobacteriota bacterium]